MATKYWIKLYHETLDDPKMARLSDRLYRRVIECFLLAGDEHNDGLLPSLQDIAWRFRCNEEQLETELIELANIGILSQQDGRWSVTKFAERQETMSKAEYMKRKRDTEKRAEHYQTTYQSRYQDVTISNTETDKEKKKNRIEQNHADIITALCQVSRGTPNDIKTLNKANDLYDLGATPEQVLSFGEWWVKGKGSKPYLPNFTTFWDEFINGRQLPDFITGKDNNKSSAEWQTVLECIKNGTPPSDGRILKAVRMVGWPKLKSATERDMPHLMRQFNEALNV